MDNMAWRQTVVTAASYQYRIYVKLIHSEYILPFVSLCHGTGEVFFFFLLLSFLDMSAAAQHHIFPTQNPNHPTGINYPAESRNAAVRNHNSIAAAGAVRSGGHRQ